ncbi:hypothetical protein JCGZ_22807 [Jatropha curcas]|uniref:Aminotransferase-like plant mobile domain-containing protein n=1 Tax=Jatropha curcas TaxID=180498 RepID=A0A067LFJ5_JATCU|nr:hypothetical protein JCGZ_22807 [Jatropha curcas]
MSQTSEIPASAYTPEMETLGALPDIPTFDGEPVPVSRNPPTSGTRPLQLLPLPGSEFPVRYETNRMRGFQAEVDLGKSRSGGSSTDASAFCDLLDSPMRARVIATGFGDYAVWAYEYRIYPGDQSGDTPAESRRIPRYLAHCHHTYANGEDPEYWRSFLNDRELSDLFLTPWDCDAWRTYPGREVAELHTRSRFLMRGYWVDRYFLGERVYDTPVAPAQRPVPHAPPRHMCLLEGMTREDLEVEYRGFSANDFLSTGDFPAYFSSWMQVQLPEILEYTQEWKTHKTAAHYRVEAAAEAGAAVAPARPAGIIPGDVPFPPGMEVVLDPDLGLGLGITIPADLRRAPPLPQLDPEHATHDLEIGRLRRHQSCQSSAVSRLQAEVDRLRTRL